MATKLPPQFDPYLFLRSAREGRGALKYSKDAVIFSQGEVADAVYYLEKGRAKLTVISANGKEAVIAILGAGDFFGEGCLSGLRVCIATATAMTESAVMRVDRVAFVRAIESEPAFAQLFMDHLLRRSIRVESDLVDQLFNSSEKRLARLLLLLANFGQETKPEPVIAKISQETLAEMVGTTRSRVSFFMNKFRKLGFIDYNGRIEVHSSLLNLLLHDEPRIKGWIDGWNWNSVSILIKYRAKWRLISMAAAAYRKAVAVATTSFCGVAAAVDPPEETFDALD
jgi:CRP/FNR family transcriptional regulator, cyclic AMP receptor protein